MKRIFKIFTLISLLAMFSCNETRRESDNDDAKTEDSNKAAEEANDDKFEDNDLENDADFVAQTVAANYAEISFAQLASQKSTDAEVKSIAQTLVNDHTKVLTELKALAQKKAISIPVEAEDKDQRKIERFYDESGKDFNKKWTKEMIDKHENSINKFEKRIEKTEDAELKAFLEKTLPHLRMHLDKLNACHEKIKDKNV
jgi:putative membrane protein